MQRLVIVLSSTLVTLSLQQSDKSGVDWFGDPRGGSQQENFYDLIYDESLCHSAIKANAVANYIYVGFVLKTVFVDSSSECLTECFKMNRCKSVNFYASRRNALKYVCELNDAAQIYDPKKMLSYFGATYYDNIECDDKVTLPTSKKEKPNDEHGLLDQDDNVKNVLRQQNQNANFQKLFKKPLELFEKQVGVH